VPERRRELRQADVELVDELVSHAAQSALRRSRPKAISLQHEHVALATLA